MRGELNSFKVKAVRAWAAPSERALQDLLAGQVVVFQSDALERGVHAAFVVAAASLTPEHLQFMGQFGGDIIWVALDRPRAERLGLREITSDRSNEQPPTLVPVDLRGTSGISLRDRAATIRALASTQSTRTDFMRPGHIFPIVVDPRTTLLGHPNIPEAAVELVRLSGREAVVAGCMLMSKGGQPAGKKEIQEAVRDHHLTVIRTQQVALYAMACDTLLEQGAVANLPLPELPFRVHAFRSTVDGRMCVVLVRGEVTGRSAVPVYLHRYSTSGDVFRSHACDCRASLDRALTALRAAPAGVLIYLVSETAESLGLSHRRGCQVPWTPYEAAIAAHALRSLDARSLVIETPELADSGLLLAITNGSRRESRAPIVASVG